MHMRRAFIIACVVAACVLPRGALAQATATDTATATPVDTNTPTATNTRTETPTPTITLTPTRTLTVTWTPVPTDTPVWTPTPDGFFCSASGTGATVGDGLAKTDGGHKSYHLDLTGNGTTASLRCKLCDACQPVTVGTPVAADYNGELTLYCTELSCQTNACTSGTCSVKAYIKP